MADTQITHTRLPAHLVQRALAFTQNRIGKCSPSAGVAYFLELYLPNAERRAVWDAIDALADDEAHAAPTPTDDELDPSKDETAEQPS